MAAAAGEETRAAAEQAVKSFRPLLVANRADNKKENSYPAIAAVIEKIRGRGKDYQAGGYTRRCGGWLCAKITRRVGERVAVYPSYEQPDISPLTHLCPAPLPVCRFVLDVHLGKLARYLRLLGFDVIYRNDLDDPEIIDIGEFKQRIILTRDMGILKNSRVTRGHWIRSTAPREQTREVVRALRLEQGFQPFSRCPDCNGVLIPADINTLKGRVAADTWRFFERFVQCEQCDKVYWKGSHYERMCRFIDGLK